MINKNNYAQKFQPPISQQAIQQTDPYSDPDPDEEPPKYPQLMGDGLRDSSVAPDENSEPNRFTEDDLDVKEIEALLGNETDSVQ